MPTLRLYGTVTSPYVRRVRIVAHELSLPYELIDAATEDGQAATREVTPIWKVPALELDDQVLLDSAVITEHLLRHHGPGPLRAFDPDDADRRNLRLVVDGALDALINAFYLGRDGVDEDSSAYVAKQQQRATSAMTWLEAHAGRFASGPEASLGLAEIALCTTLEWMRFRQTHPVERYPALLRVVDSYGARDSFVRTRPH